MEHISLSNLNELLVHADFALMSHFFAESLSAVSYFCPVVLLLLSEDMG